MLILDGILDCVLIFPLSSIRPRRPRYQFRSTQQHLKPLFFVHLGFRFISDTHFDISPFLGRRTFQFTTTMPFIQHTFSRLIVAALSISSLSQHVVAQSIPVAYCSTLNTATTNGSMEACRLGMEAQLLTWLL